MTEFLGMIASLRKAQARLFEQWQAYEMIGEVIKNLEEFDEEEREAERIWGKKSDASG